MLGLFLEWESRIEEVRRETPFVRMSPPVSPASAEMVASPTNKQDDPRRQRESEDKAAQEWSVHAISNE